MPDVREGCGLVFTSTPSFLSQLNTDPDDPIRSMNFTSMYLDRLTAWRKDALIGSVNADVEMTYLVCTQEVELNCRFRTSGYQWSGTTGQALTCRAQ